MYRINEIEMRAHIDEMIRASENERLARQLKAECLRIAFRIKNALFGLAHLSQRKEAAQY